MESRMESRVYMYIFQPKETATAEGTVTIQTTTLQLFFSPSYSCLAAYYYYYYYYFLRLHFSIIYY